MDNHTKDKIHQRIYKYTWSLINGWFRRSVDQLYIIESDSMNLSASNFLLLLSVWNFFSYRRLASIHYAYRLCQITKLPMYLLFWDLFRPMMFLYLKKVICETLNTTNTLKTFDIVFAANIKYLKFHFFSLAFCY